MRFGDEAGRGPSRNVLPTFGVPFWNVPRRFPKRCDGAWVKRVFEEFLILVGRVIERARRSRARFDHEIEPACWIIAG